MPGASGEGIPPHLADERNGPILQPPVRGAGASGILEILPHVHVSYRPFK